MVVLVVVSVVVGLTGDGVVELVEALVMVEGSPRATLRFLSRWERLTGWQPAAIANSSSTRRFSARPPPRGHRQASSNLQV